MITSKNVLIGVSNATINYCFVAFHSQNALFVFFVYVLADIDLLKQGYQRIFVSLFNSVMKNDMFVLKNEL